MKKTIIIIAAVVFGLGLAQLAYAVGVDQGRAAVESVGRPTIPELVAQVDTGSDPHALDTTEPDVGGHDPVRILDQAWGLWERGLVTPALMLTFHVALALLLANWAWLSGRLPWLVNGRWLAVVSAISGATTGLVPLAAAGDLTAAAGAYALLTAIAQYVRPTPKVVKVPTEGGEPERITRPDLEIQPGPILVKAP